MRTRREHAVGDLAGDHGDELVRAPARPKAPREHVELLAKEIAQQLVANHGGLTRRTTAVGDVDLWRRAARRAGRLLCVPVRTGVSDDGSKVWVVDES